MRAVANIEIVEARSRGREEVSTLNLQPKPKSETQPLDLSHAERDRAYVEVPGLRHETRDVLKQLDSNILLLEDLGGRLGFVLAELRSLIRK